MSRQQSEIFWWQSPMDERTAAFFDVDRTLLKGNIVYYYAFLRRREMGPIWRLVWTAGLLTRVPGYLIVDRISREKLITRFYRNYRGFTRQRLRAGAEALFAEELKPKVYPEALNCIERHRAAGQDIVLISGSIREIVTPVAKYVGADHTLCSDLEETEGVFTGALLAGTLTGHRKAEALVDYARRHKVCLSASHAYADSLDDLPMLSQVGNPVAVNPDARLERIASRKGWGVQQWNPGCLET